MKTYRVIYKPTGELVLDAAARYRGIDRLFKRTRLSWSELSLGEAIEELDRSFLEPRALPR
jgi:hypothetical protein